MTVPANTFRTTDSIGIREDLLDDIFDVSKSDTPLLSSISSVRAKGTTHEWQTDILAAAVDTNAHEEGDDTVAVAVVPTVRLSNQTQISKKARNFSGTDLVADNAGRGVEREYQLVRDAIVLKTDIEKSAFANKATVAGATRVCGGMEAWIASNDSFGAGGASPTGDGTNIRTDGTPRVFDEADLKTVLAAMATAGAKPKKIFLDAFNKQAMSAFDGNAPRRTDSRDKILMNAIDVYDSDFGDIQTVFSINHRGRSAIIIDPEMLALATHRDMKQTQLATTGDAEKWQIVMEWTLEVKNELGLGGVFDLTVA